MQSEPSWLSTILTNIDAVIGWFVNGLSEIFFFDLVFWDNGRADDVTVPLLVAWLAAGALFFTLRFSFVNLRAFGHALDCVRGRYTSPDDPGEISHFQALSAALSATVGLGNIAGVAVAVGIGGPGAVPWMILAGFLGMSSKFAECTLGQRYRVERDDGHVSGGPMHYLADGFMDLGWPRLGTGLATAFAVLCIFASFGGGNMFQANQAFAQLASPAVLDLTGPTREWAAVVFGLVLAGLVGLVIIGGIKRIGQVAGVLVPFMCLVYLLCGLLILLFNLGDLPGALGFMLRQSVSGEAVTGGAIGSLMVGFQRAAFSNEAGIGSAAIAHSAASTSEPVREGMVALLGPFIDTIVVCTMTGLVIVVTGAHQQGIQEGIEMTSWAFARVFSWFPVVLSVTAGLFAYSTMISWSYYGEQCWAHLFGTRAILLYKVLFLICVWIGTVASLGNVITFADLMLLGMAFPNVLGVVMLSSRVRVLLQDYLARLQSGEIVRYG